MDRKSPRTFRAHLFALLIFITTLLTGTAPIPSWADSQCPSPLCGKPYSPEGVLSADIMAPLIITCEEDWRAFKQQLKIAKDTGIRAVTVDVWWGLVEKDGDQKFHWEYYDRIVMTIQEAGLHWVPIMSFHQCGGNVGDECNIPIPNWIWTAYPDVMQENLKYQSEKDNFSNETVSLWMDNLVMKQYTEFMSEFEKHFGSKMDIVAMTDEINISLGPAGELRFPSYNSHDGWHYPGRGYFQAYSKPARDDFRRFVVAKYNSLDRINKAWNSQLTDLSQIGPPDDGNPQYGRASSFLGLNDYKYAQYGKDFIDWYHESLVEHGRRMLDAATTSFKGSFSGKALGIKMSGVHWQMMNNAPQPRVAEITAGLIKTSDAYDSPVTGHGYNDLMNMISSFRSRKKLYLYFTCLEMDDEPVNDPKSYSLAKTLVFWVAQAAEAAGVSIKGENALSGGVRSDGGWNSIENAFCYAPYMGLTILRLNDVSENPTYVNRHRCFIRNYLKN